MNKSELIKMGIDLSVFSYRARVFFKNGLVLNCVKVVIDYGVAEREKEGEDKKVLIISMKDPNIDHIEKLLWN